MLAMLMKPYSSVIPPPPLTVNTYTTTQQLIDAGFLTMGPDHLWLGTSQMSGNNSYKDLPLDFTQAEFTVYYQSSYGYNYGGSISIQDIMGNSVCNIWCNNAMVYVTPSNPDHVFYVVNEPLNSGMELTLKYSNGTLQYYVKGNMVYQETMDIGLIKRIMFSATYLYAGYVKYGIA